jgi:2-methylcitrate dehydratase PrpD
MAAGNPAPVRGAEGRRSGAATAGDGLSGAATAGDGLSGAATAGQPPPAAAWPSGASPAAAWPSGASPAAAFITGLTWEDLPPQVVRRAVMCVIDTLGAMLAGRSARATKIAAETAGAWWPAQGAHLIADGSLSSAAGAAFANAVAANAVDVDDCGIYTWGHPGAQVVPSALALAEQEHLDGRELLLAVVVGYEIAFRASRCLNLAASRVSSAERTYRACGSWGALACAAIACRALVADADFTRHALGIAEYHSPDLPLMRDLDSPGMVKHGVGPGALTGLLAADLAIRGFTGIPSSLDLPEFRGFVEDLGSHYLLPHGITWKRFACCAWAHPALLAVERLLARHEIAPGMITKILVETYPDAVRLGTSVPVTTEEAQFSLAWPIAALILDGQVGPDQVLDGALSSTAHAELCSRVDARVTAELTRLYDLSERNDPAGKDAAVVTITLSNGRTFSSGLVEHVLYPEPGWSEDDMARKFAWLAAGHLAPADIDEITAALLELERAGDVADLMAGLSSALRPAV